MQVWWEAAWGGGRGRESAWGKGEGSKLSRVSFFFVNSCLPSPASPEKAGIDELA